MKLDPTRIRDALRVLIRVAERWGISDDGDRGDAVRAASRPELGDLVSAVQSVDADVWDEWLSGSEAHSAEPSDEYIAFSATRMAGDLAQQLNAGAGRPGSRGAMR